MTVISLSIENELLSRFDKVCKQEGYHNRSEAVRSSMRDFIHHYEIPQDTKDELIEVIVVFTYHDSKYIRSKLEKVEEKHDHFIREKLHKHIFEDLCFDMFTLRGIQSKLNSALNQLRAIKNLESFHTFVIPLIHEH